MTQTVGSGTRPKLGPDYWRLWWANAISSTGDGAFVAALPLLAVTITRDPRLVSVVTAATYLPWLVLSLPAGVLVDRYDRATLMWQSQAIQAAVVTIVAILVLFGQANIAVLSVAGLLLGSAEVIFSNAAQSVLPDLVPPELLAKANGSQQVSLTVGESFLGPPAACCSPRPPRCRSAWTPPRTPARRRCWPDCPELDCPEPDCPEAKYLEPAEAPGSVPRSPKGCAGWPGTACCAWSPSCSACTTSPIRWARPPWSCWRP